MNPGIDVDKVRKIKYIHEFDRYFIPGVGHNSIKS